MNAASTCSKMAVGACCDPECRFIKQAREAFLSQEQLPSFAGSFVKMVCSKQGSECAGQMHEYCFDKMVDKAIQEINKKPGRGTLNRREQEKAIWDQTKSGKFDIIRDSRVIKCVCGGYVRPLIGSSRSDYVMTCKPVDSSPKKAKTKKQSEKKKRIVNMDGEDDDEYDEFQKMHIYDRQEKEISKEENITQTNFVMQQTDYPDLPATFSLPPPIRDAPRITRVRIPTFKVRTNIANMHIIAVDRIGTNPWIARLIGRNGERLKRFDRQYGTRTKVDTARSDYIGIYINMGDENKLTKGHGYGPRERRELLVNEIQSLIIACMTED